MISSLRRFLPKPFRNDKPVIPVVRLYGAIGGGGPLKSGLSLATASIPLEKAFSMKKAPAVALVVPAPAAPADALAPVAVGDASIRHGGACVLSAWRRRSS